MVPEAMESRPMGKEQLHTDAHIFLRSTDVLKISSDASNKSRKQESPGEDFDQKSFLVSVPVTPLSSLTLP